MEYAKSCSGLSYLRQAAILFSLRQKDNRIGIDDYYDLRLYESDKFESGDLDTFIGWKRAPEIINIFNDRNWRVCANDKIVCYSMLQAGGIKIPSPIVTYSPIGRRIGNERVITKADSFVDFLRSEAQFPVFMKPVVSTLGRSAFLLSGYDADNRQWLLANGKTLPENHLRQVIEFAPYDGILVQDVLQQHPVMQEHLGPIICSVRMMVMKNDGNPFIFAAFLKVVVGKNMTDNFLAGKSGNLIAWVNVETGLVERAITGLGENYREVEIHPDTGKRLKGLIIPDWAAAVAMCRSGAPCFPGLGFQFWDVAFSDSGPVAIEVNTEPAFDQIQLAARRGFWNDTMKAAIATETARRHRVAAEVSRRNSNPDLNL